MSGRSSQEVRELIARYENDLNAKRSECEELEVLLEDLENELDDILDGVDVDSDDNDDED